MDLKIDTNSVAPVNADETRPQPGMCDLMRLNPKYI